MMAWRGWRMVMMMKAISLLEKKLTELLLFKMYCLWASVRVEIT